MAFIVEDGTNVDNANSWCSVADADAYHATHLYATTWTAATTQTKEKALIMSTRLLDTGIRWRGTKTYLESALSWPRQDIVTIDGQTLSSSSIPSYLLNATAELARLMIESDRTAEGSSIGVEAVTVGSIELKMTQAASRGVEKPVIPRSVLALLNGLGVPSGQGTVLILGRA